MSSKPLTDRPEWAALQSHYAALSQTPLKDLYAQDDNRFTAMSGSVDGLLFDYSKTLMSDETISLLVDLAKACDLEGQRSAMTSGALLNTTENRAALHMALRGSIAADVVTEGQNVNALVSENLEHMRTLSEKIRVNKTITDIVHIGIGGSDLGPRMTYKALSAHHNGPRVHFVSNIDGAHLSQTLAALTPKNTLFIVASKTFTSLETIKNARSAKDWLGGLPVADHFIAVTGNAQGAENFGITPDNILPVYDWVGGRFSVWSGIGLCLSVSLGHDAFEQFLAGAHSMDQHFLSAPFEKNLPVIMALLGIWHRNFCGYEALAVVPYAQNLKDFPAYIQQLDMESNGKSVTRGGREVDYHTAPLILSGIGTDSQHAFFQLLHQGSTIVPCDFIIAANPDVPLSDHHDDLIANVIAQSEALLLGDENNAASHENFEGNRPSSTIVLQRLDPYHLGMLMALYEHKIFVQGIIWDVNSFDQWGVELGKKIAKNTRQALENKDELKTVSTVSKGLLNYILRNKA
ncbi:MAG: glucose-6-phosphate isomerase [Alphaproteobacteria bacterium]|nr:glucose-6-phosphate isomerase [Alphaproteobacteria bacterium]